jgi:predicted DNA-binding transcriptional regulator YafY
LSRSQRLLDLIQLLRRHRHPVSGADIARELGISLRSLYRDVATLQAQGAPIEGAPGLGYVLRDGFTLPPLMFSVDEIEALVLGTRWVMDRGDTRLAAAARDALAKVAAVLPAPLRHELDSSALLVGPGPDLVAGDTEGATLRAAIRHEHKLAITYRDVAGADTQRTVWPFALGYFDRARVLVAWCELRSAIRHFRCDRITALAELDQRYPQRRQALLKMWRQEQGIAER